MYVDYGIVLVLLADQWGKLSLNLVHVHNTYVFFAVSTNPDSHINLFYSTVVIFTPSGVIWCFLKFCATNQQCEVNCLGMQFCPRLNVLSTNLPERFTHC